MAAKSKAKSKSGQPEANLDEALEQSFPASDPISVSNPTTGTKTDADIAPDVANLDARIRERAEKLWHEAGSPKSGVDAFLDDARTLLAIEDDPKAGTLPNPLSRRDNTGPEGEPIEPPQAVENEGEFPTLTDQGDQTYPPRRARVK
jgi:hypothetical protein